MKQRLHITVGNTNIISRNQGMLQFDDVMRRKQDVLDLEAHEWLKVIFI